MQDRERLVPVRLRAPADPALRVLRVEEVDVDHQLVERRLAVEVGLGLHRRVDGGARVLLRLFPRLGRRAHEALHEVRVLPDRVAGGHDRHADDVGAEVGVAHRDRIAALVLDEEVLVVRAAQQRIGLLLEHGDDLGRGVDLDHADLGAVDVVRLAHAPAAAARADRRA